MKMKIKIQSGREYTRDVEKFLLEGVLGGMIRKSWMIRFMVFTVKPKLPVAKRKNQWFRYHYVSRDRHAHWLRAVPPPRPRQSDQPLSLIDPDHLHYTRAAMLNLPIPLSFLHRVQIRAKTRRNKTLSHRANRRSVAGDSVLLSHVTRQVLLTKDGNFVRGDRRGERDPPLGLAGWIFPIEFDRRPLIRGYYNNCFDCNWGKGWEYKRRSYLYLSEESFLYFFYSRKM